MSRKLFSETASKIVAGLIVAAIGAIVGLFIVPEKTKQIVLTTSSWIASLFLAVWEHFTSSASIPRWLFYILLLMSGLFVLRTLSRLFGRIPPPAPDYASYTEGIFFNVKWRWDYSSDYREIRQIAAYCLICDTVLASVGYGFTYTQFHCDTCNREDSFIQRSLGDLEGTIRRQTEQKIRTGRWKQFPNGDNQS